MYCFPLQIWQPSYRQNIQFHHLQVTYSFKIVHTAYIVHSAMPETLASGGHAWSFVVVRQSFYTDRCRDSHTHWIWYLTQQHWLAVSVSYSLCISTDYQYYPKHVHRGIRPCPHGKFANHSQMIVYVLRRIARVHTGETGTNVPAGFERPRRDMERAGVKRSRAVDFVLWMFDRGLALAREYLPW